MMSEQRLERSSSFSITFCRLSQYLRENGGLRIAPRPQEPPTTKGAFLPPVTMNLLPGTVVPADDQPIDTTTAGDASKSMNLFPQHAGVGAADDTKKAKLTIFYGGKVLVFDNFPADKARDLMLVVGRGSSATQNFHSASTVADRRPTVASAAASGCLMNQHVPIARRASLHRFLEKRKDRINSKAPYQVVNSSAKPVEVDPAKATEVARPWLGLGPALSNDSRR